MAEYNTLKRNYLKTQQTLLTTDNIYDLEKAVIATVTSKDYETVNVPSDWRLYFAGEGYEDAYTANLSTLWYRWLGSKGFTQSNLRDRFKAFYADGSVDLCSEDKQVNGEVLPIISLTEYSTPSGETSVNEIEVEAVSTVSGYMKIYLNDEFKVGSENSDFIWGGFDMLELGTYTYYVTIELPGGTIEQTETRTVIII